MTKRKIVKLLAVVLILTLSVVFVACSDNSAGLDKVKESGKLVLGTSADYPPYEFHKEINGEDTIVGFDIEIAKEIAKDLGVELEIKDMKFGGLLAALQTNKVDLVIAGMTPDTERAKEVDFSNIYYNAEHGVAVRAEDKDIYKTAEDLAGKTIGVQQGAIQEDIAKEQIENPNVKAIGKVSDLMLQLINGKVDAIVVEDVVGESYAENNKELFLTDIRFTDEEGGSAIAVKKGNKELLDSINSTLERLEEKDLIDKFVLEANKMVVNE